MVILRCWYLVESELRAVFQRPPGMRLDDFLHYPPLPLRMNFFMIEVYLVVLEWTKSISAYAYSKIYFSNLSVLIP